MNTSQTKSLRKQRTVVTRVVVSMESSGVSSEWSTSFYCYPQVLINIVLKINTHLLIVNLIEIYIYIYLYFLLNRKFELVYYDI